MTSEKDQPAGYKYVLIVDDHRLVAECLAWSLDREGIAAAEVLTEVTDIPELITSLRSAPPSLALIDLDLGDHANRGMELARQLVDISVPTIIFTGNDQPELLGRCLEIGVMGVLQKSTPIDDCVRIVEDALDGGTVNADSAKYEWMMAALRNRQDYERRMAPFNSLTTREQEVLGGLINGLRPDDIADLGHVNVVTVRSQIRQIYQKLGVRSQLGAVASATSAGWSPPPTSPGVGSRRNRRVPHGLMGDIPPVVDGK